MMPKSASMFYRQAEPRRGFRGHGPLLRGIARYLWERALPAKGATRSGCSTAIPDRPPVIKFPFYANSELDDE